MTVIAFPRFADPREWTVSERQALVAVVSGPQDGTTWETGRTECGDPQLYLLGPLPEQACELCISKSSGGYILEDGAGRLLIAHRRLDVVVARAEAARRGPRHWLVARIVVLWCIVRQTVHERVEPMLAEGEDLLIHVAPQLAMFA